MRQYATGYIPADRSFLVRLCWRLSVVLAACSKPAPTAQSAPAEAQAKRFHLVGKIVSIDAANNSLTIDHQAIPGFMDAMTMAYSVRSAQALTGLGPGDEITADVVVPDVGNAYIENIMVTKKGAGTSSGAAGGPTAASHEPQPGERVPDFAFRQSGRQAHPSELVSRRCAAGDVHLHALPVS